MRVLFVTDALNNGGAERQLTLLASSLPPTHQASVLTLDGGVFCEVLRDSGVPVEVFPRRLRYDLTPALRMWKAAEAIDPDVVHSWGSLASWAMWPYCRRARIPLIGVIRNARTPRRRNAARPNGAPADLVVANTRAGLAAYGVPDERGRVVYNGFDTSRLATIPQRAEPSAFPEVTTVVMAARMSPEKDWSTYLRAARRLSATDSGGWRFVAVGDGPDRLRLMKEATDLVRSGVLTFASAGTEILPVVASADVGVLLTDTRFGIEGCSNSVMEYMACGLPVVCTDCGGNPELVEGGATGHLIPPRDDEKLVARLLELRRDSTRASAMGQAGAARLRQQFTVQSMVDGYLSAYEWACSR